MEMSVNPSKTFTTYYDPDPVYLNWSAYTLLLLGQKPKLMNEKL